MDASEDRWVIYNLENEFLYSNYSNKSTAGVPDDYDLIGRHLSEPPAPIFENCAVNLIEQNEQVKKHGKLKFINIHPVGYSDDWFCDVGERSLLEDEYGVFCAVIVNARPVLKIWQETLKTLQTVHRYYTGESQVVMNVLSPESLSEKQAEIVFFILCGVEPKVIARYLNCSVNGIHKCIDRIRLKLGVSSTKQLIEKVLFMDWHKLLPRRLMYKQLAMVIN
ncbi:MAG: helix-turn-helix transcriptional regulator [Endozoicomonas sp.]